ncbi:hypothetical protein OROHE_020495 [Orobanche hederae]
MEVLGFLIKKGKYLAAGTRACIILIPCPTTSKCEEDVSQQVSHVSQDEMKQINSIKWNPTDQNEIACGSRRLYDLHIYDCYAPSPTEPKIGCRRRAHNEDWLVGLSDVAFASTNQSCIVASDLEYPTVAIWDTRANNGLPVRELRFGVHGEATCLQYSEFDSDQHLVGGGSDGKMCLWDLRVGDTPTQQWSLIDLTRDQHLINGRASRRITCIDSINFNPSNQRQLAFHVNNSWSGVIGIHTSSISHIYRPCSRLGLEEACRDPFYIRRCSWVANTSIYMAPSRNAIGILLLDFNWYKTSPYHVESE